MCTIKGAKEAIGFIAGTCYLHKMVPLPYNQLFRFLQNLRTHYQDQSRNVYNI